MTRIHRYGDQERQHLWEAEFCVDNWSQQRIWEMHGCQTGGKVGAKLGDNSDGEERGAAEGKQADSTGGRAARPPHYGYTCRPQQPKGTCHGCHAPTDI